MEENFLINRNEFEKLRIDFQNQNTIKKLEVSTYNDSARVTGINKWSCCYQKQWRKDNENYSDYIYLPSLEEVLSNENIKQNQYSRIVEKMIKLNLESIGSGYDCSDCIEFETGRAGLRFYNNKESKLKPDDEYLSVVKVADNWFVYQRDWN